ncbi:MAG TPA: FlgD immunoglobulin-like domain containing protein [Candidatus Eisenbacteria bacterium]|nr:FlgD immunoglobulin-like domain containing protein [Candidatus Eisenbacteria bacterium]
MRRLLPLLACFALALGAAALPRHLQSRAAVTSDFTHFESGHVHPACMTPDGTRLLVVNTPDDRLAIFDVEGPVPVRVAEVPVGLEPVSVAARSDSEAWVVNQLSDDVSIVNLNTRHVRATLHVGDEPADVVFAGSPPRAWVSVSQEDRVKSFDPANLATAPVVVPIDGRMPRALAASADGAHVYVAVFNAGNRTSVLSSAEAGDSLPPPNPPMNPALPAAPKVGLIVQQQGSDWRDETGRLWNDRIKYTSFDTDVADIATATHGVVRTISNVGAVNFAVAVSPTSGVVAVTGTEPRNLTRFEPNLRGHLVDTRLALAPSSGPASVVSLDPHVDYAITPGPQAERDSALGIPTGLAWSGDGQRVYVTSLASDRLGVLDASGALHARVPTVAGPTGVVVDDARGRIYVVGRFHEQLQTLSSATLAPLATTAIGFDPTPDAVVNGRKFFYGGFTSGHGDQACATCHVFGDFDNLSWDLGDPTGTMIPIDRTGQTDPLIAASVHPMKGPMATQSLRGLPNTGMFHWRGDRHDLTAFNPAFVSLMGRAAPLADSEMTALSEFVMALVYPPNPNEFLDRTVPDAPAGVPSAKRGQTFFNTVQVDGNVLRCADCHTDASFGPGTNGQIIDRTALQAPQDMKVPQLRNLYKKTGFTDTIGVVDKRGFGYTHDGAVDNLFDFLKFPGFNFGSPQSTADANRRDVAAFLMAFDTGTAPAIGVQITFDGTNGGDATLTARVDTLRAQAAAGTCDLVAKGRVGGQPRGWLYQSGSATWKSDKAAGAALSTPSLLALAGPGSELTVTGVPAGSGTRMGIDRDRDGYLDGDELDAGSDPGNPASTPNNVGVAGGSLRDGASLAAARPNPFRGSTMLAYTLPRAAPVSLVIYDVLGREVRVLDRGTMTAGTHAVAWDGRRDGGAEAGAGVYFARLETGGGHWTRAVVRVR